MEKYGQSVYCTSDAEKDKVERGWRRESREVEGGRVVLEGLITYVILPVGTFIREPVSVPSVIALSCSHHR